MPNKKSAKKRMRQNVKRYMRNRAHKGRMKTFIKKTRKAIEAGDLELARELFRQTMSVIDKTAQKGIIHRNKAARLKSRLNARLKALALQLQTGEQSAAGEQQAQA